MIRQYISELVDDTKTAINVYCNRNSWFLLTFAIWLFTNEISLSIDALLYAYTFYNNANTETTWHCLEAYI